MATHASGAAKRPADSTAASSAAKRGRGGDSGDGIGNSSDGASGASDASTSEERAEIRIAPRRNEFSERTWWMVDMEQSDEGGGSTNQGATALVKRCMRTHGWTLEKARKILTAYRQFLTLKKDKKDWDAELLSPSLLVDQMWHQHILDVVNYCHDMMLICGRVVGHNPDGALSGKKERDEATLEALEQRFPNYDKEIWGVDVKPGVKTEPEYEAETSDEAEHPEGDSDQENGSEAFEAPAGKGDKGAVERDNAEDAGANKDDANGGGDADDAEANNTNKGGAYNNAIANDTIDVRIRDARDGEETTFTIYKHCELATIFGAFATSKGVPLPDLVFLKDRPCYDQKARVLPNKTSGAGTAER